MRYLPGIYEAEARLATMTPEDSEALMAAYYAFGEEAGKAGVLIGGARSTRRARRRPTGTRIAALYDQLMTLSPSPVVELNRAARSQWRVGPSMVSC